MDDCCLIGDDPFQFINPSQTTQQQFDEALFVKLVELLAVNRFQRYHDLLFSRYLIGFAFDFDMNSINFLIPSPLA